ncbi:Ig-like domain-containing protein [Natrinema ejinorense]|uniref:Uncharacterized protein n=1 Tax=Natrinema ejinorense TaxID=373386 RepID=A0A2A5QSS2_9EURY|nr:Ig-like domain-containing protein [Natrinema ejinorense]PCR89854.1 hypothetical protein CP557_04465 [Natrinema ejinorense]
MFGSNATDRPANDTPSAARADGNPSLTERFRSGRNGEYHETDRAVSPVIGAILMFALLLALLALLQTTAIPALNEGLEFQHNERVQTDVGAVDRRSDRVAATGTSETVSIESGLRYPPRLFFVNPPPAAGTVRTTDPRMIEIANATAAGETGDYWNGTPRTFETRSLEYVPDYNEYGNAPVTVAEPWVVYDRFDETAATRAEQDLVDGRRIEFVALAGERSVSRPDDVSIDIEPTSAPTRTVTVDDGNEPITLTIPTRLPADEWKTLLADELDPAGDPDDDRYVTAIDCQQAPPDPCGQLTLTLEQGATYELRLGAVALGSGVGDVDAAYLTDIEGNATAIPESGRQRLVVEARDRFDNPVSGVHVTGSVSGDGTVRAVDSVTDAEGRATFVYDAPDDVDGTRDVEPTLRIGDGPSRETSFEIRVMDRDGGPNTGGGSGDGGSSGPGSEPSVTITDVVATGNSGQDRYDVTLETVAPDGTVDSVDLQLRNPTTGRSLDSASVPPGGGTVTVSTQGNSRLSAYRIVATATDADGNTWTDETTVGGNGS